jgi:hypothetical protein
MTAQALPVFRELVASFGNLSKALKEWKNTGAALGRTATYINNVPGGEWTSYPYLPKPGTTIYPRGHENTLGRETGEW